ncbi:MAG: hypothetical protein IKE90_03565 [Bacilli bacterium]|nr:hypothetical protein [Bacilli bacterium]
MIELDDAIEIRNLGYDHTLEEQLKGIIERKGQKYRKIERPVTIEIITEPREIPADSFDLFYSDGDESNRVVPAGTILMDGKYVITEESLNKKYEPLLDEKGNIIPGKYVKKTFITAVKNPFGKKIRDINGNGVLLREYDVDCYFMIDSISGKVAIVSKESFERSYTIADENKKTVLKNNDKVDETSHQEYEEAKQAHDEISKSAELLTELKKIRRAKHFSNETKDELINEAENTSRIR